MLPWAMFQTLKSGSGFQTSLACMSGDSFQTSLV
jgi:hypothetical protein